MLTQDQFIELFLNADDISLDSVEKILEEAQPHFELQEMPLNTEHNTSSHVQ